MATAAGDVIYRQGFDDDNSDVWDDSALIKAYDEAITSLRSGIVPENKKSSSKKSKKSKSKSPRNKVKKGCKCKFYYENEFIVGEVTSIDQNTGTCQVVYGHEEENNAEILLDQVVPITQDEYETHLKMFDATGDYEDEEGHDVREEDYDGQAHNIDYNNQSAEYYQRLNNYKSGNFSRDSTSRNNFWNRVSYNYPNYGTDNSYYPSAHYPPPLPPPPVPPMHAHPSSYMPPFHQPGMQEIPVPPLPPQPPPLAKDDINDELLSNLIMSWYMAGYRTGYYQAIRKAKDKSRKK